MATGRLTADLILRSPQHLDPTNLYSLDLRGAFFLLLLCDKRGGAAVVWVETCSSARPVIADHACPLFEQPHTHTQRTQLQATRSAS